MKRNFLLMVVAVLAFTIASVPVIGAAKPVKIAAISGYFAQGMGKLIVDALNKANKDFKAEIKLIDTGTRSLDYEEQFSSVAKSGEYELVFVLGWELVNALEKTAKAYPQQKFVFIDGVLSDPNMLYVDFTEEEGSFLAGAMAAMMTSKSGVKGINPQKKIGFVGGRDIPVIRNFLTGYEQGAKYVDPAVEVKAVFAGTFDDPARGNELALALYGSGVDIVYNVAGPTGEGVLLAAKNSQKYAIGVDVDQCSVAPGFIMGSMLKKVDVAVYDLVKSVASGKPVKPGVYTYGISQDGVGLCFDSEMLRIVPKDVVKKLQDIRAKIKSGAIKVKSVL